MQSILKKCKKCLLDLDLKDFYKHPQTKDGYLNFCKKCFQEKSRLAMTDDRAKNNLQRALLWNKENKEKRNKKLSERHRRIREEVISHYSNGQNKCANCGINKFEFLAIDHVNGGGSKHNKKIFKSSRGSMSLWLKKESFPSGFQILCHNCNFLKHFNTLDKTNLTPQQKTAIKRRNECFDKYGWECKFCKETSKDLLCIDHIEGNGNKHRKELGYGGGIYWWLKKNNYPERFPNFMS